jgi:hypothetical protein
MIYSAFVVTGQPGIWREGISRAQEPSTLYPIRARRRPPSGQDSGSQPGTSRTLFGLQGGTSSVVEAPSPCSTRHEWTWRVRCKRSYIKRSSFRRCFKCKPVNPWGSMILKFPQSLSRQASSSGREGAVGFCAAIWCVSRESFPIR